MGFESKIISREIGDILYASGLSVATAESCTGGRIGEGIIAIPGASNYYKGGVIAYTNEIKENVLGVSADLIDEQTAVCEDVAKQMVLGAIKVMNTDFAISATGVAGPGGGSAQITVGTIWLACGSEDDIVTMKLVEDFGRDINLAIATNKALRLFLDYLRDREIKAEALLNEKKP